MNIKTKNRVDLKAYFDKGKKPSQDDFRELIDATVNQADDGLSKPPNDPLSIQATGDATGPLKVINFYRNFKDPGPAWSISLNPPVDPKDTKSRKPGFGICDAGDKCRLFIDGSSGNIGIGTVDAKNTLDVQSADRTSTHPTNRALYVTGDLGDLKVGEKKGIEFRHSNGTQGIGFGYNGIYATGSNPAQDIYLAPRGTGSVVAGYYKDSAFKETIRISPPAEGQSTGTGTKLLRNQRLTVKGDLDLGNSALYFTDPDHTCAVAGITPPGNVPGCAAIENAKDFSSLMILGRQTGANSAVGERVVTMWDRVGIGISDPKAKLEVAGNVLLGGQFISRNAYLDASNVWQFKDPGKLSTAILFNDTGSFTFYATKETPKTEWRELMTLRNNGEVVIEGNLFVKGKLNFYWADHKQWKRVGDYSEKTGTYASSKLDAGPSVSDTRLKTDLHPIPSALAKVSQLRGVTFRWNELGLQHLTRDIEATLTAGPGATGEENRKLWQEERAKRCQEHSMPRVGVLAQEVEAVLPEAVTTGADGYKSVNYYELIPLVIEALKEEDKISQEQARTIARQQTEIQRLTAASQAAQKQLGELHEIKRKLVYLEAARDGFPAPEGNTLREQLSK